MNKKFIYVWMLHVFINLKHDGAILSAIKRFTICKKYEPVAAGVYSQV